MERNSKSNWHKLWNKLCILIAAMTIQILQTGKNPWHNLLLFLFLLYPIKHNLIRWNLYWLVIEVCWAEWSCATDSSLVFTNQQSMVSSSAITSQWPEEERSKIFTANRVYAINTQNKTCFKKLSVKKHQTGIESDTAWNCCQKPCLVVAFGWVRYLTAFGSVLHHTATTLKVLNGHLRTHRLLFYSLYECRRCTKIKVLEKPDYHSLTTRG